MAEISRYAVVIDGLVDNVVLWDGQSAWQPPQGSVVACPDEVAPGWQYDPTSGFSPPAAAA